MNKLSTRFASLLLTLGSIGVGTGYAADAPTASCVCDPCVCDPCECAPAHPAVCTPACAPVTTDCCSFEVGLDTLYWKPCVDDLDYAAKVHGTVSNIDTPLHVDYKSVCPEWEPGYRIFLKKENAWKSFNLSLSYTWLNADDSERSHAGNGERIAAVGLHPLLVDAVDQNSNYFDFARGKWELTYQTFDILLSHPFRCGSCHTITPFFGVEIVKFDQEWDAKYELTPAGGVPSALATAEWRLLPSGVPITKALV
ncbi:Lpg1974 family pore-forming outer membrane protein [Estrella lausannensis]|uniref:Outer membrane protein n=1 Tax=Estrella lausannensis TaxID=483423 RepID=A0A0H5DPW7_9BACT|nr:Lpg1974 family pore-forming outer membrane protein [Estrella lausannensis]CRX38636.1 Outer membrane protein [Estrella lausannensis]